LTPPPASPAAAAPGSVKTGKAPTADDGRELWSRTQAAVAPLKRKR
jgi:hypothetical protein